MTFKIVFFTKTFRTTGTFIRFNSNVGSKMSSEAKVVHKAFRAGFASVRLLAGVGQDVTLHLAGRRKAFVTIAALESCLL